MPDDASTITLGEALKRRREQRGIQLNQIAEATRIGVRFLRAIEDNDFRSLPGGLFTRSFIRTYARYVGLDENTAIALYYQQTGDAQEKKYELSTEAIRAKVRSSQWANAVILLALLAVVAIGGYAGWHWWKRTFGASSPPPPQQTLQSKPQPPIAQPTRPTGTETESILATGNQEATQPPLTPANPQTEPTTSPEKPTTASTPSSPETTPTTTRLQLNIAAQGECWVSVRADDAPPQRETLHQGETLSLPANNRLVITIGNTSLVTVTINGRPVALPTTGVVAQEVVITPDNLQQFIKSGGQSYEEQKEFNYGFSRRWDDTPDEPIHDEHSGAG
jgi:cytoskeletal protein RodZ